MQPGQQGGDVARLPTPCPQPLAADAGRPRLCSPSPPPAFVPAADTIPPQSPWVPARGFHLHGNGRPPASPPQPSASGLLRAACQGFGDAVVKATPA